MLKKKENIFVLQINRNRFDCLSWRIFELDDFFDRKHKDFLGYRMRLSLAKII